jgi:hypothetical protein
MVVLLLSGSSVLYFSFQWLAADRVLKPESLIDTGYSLFPTVTYPSDGFHFA